MSNSDGSKLYRVKEGAVFSGVCQGLEVCGRGSAVAYRLLFIFGTLFYAVGLVIYIAMAISHPVASKEQIARLRKEQMARLREDADDGSIMAFTPGGLDEVQGKLAKIQEMKEKDLITSEEAEKLRAKVLGIN